MWSYIKVIVWGTIWLLVWIIMVPLRGNRQNCLSWAIEKWDQEGGYLVMRWCRSNRSQWIMWPHFLWLPEDKHHQLEHVIPVPEQDDAAQIVPKVWFDHVHMVGDHVNVNKNKTNKNHVWECEVQNPHKL